MPAKEGKKGGQGGGDDKDLGPRNVLQAVVLADSFTQSFRPITLEHPKALLPLVNVAMIEYTLEWLAMSGVEEVREAAWIITGCLNASCSSFCACRVFVFFCCPCTTSIFHCSFLALLQ